MSGSGLMIERDFRRFLMICFPVILAFDFSMVVGFRAASTPSEMLQFLKFLIYDFKVSCCIYCTCCALICCDFYSISIYTFS